MSASVLTLHEVADELGVHYMTAYRYVRLGQLEATKPGGTWEVTRAALESFKRGEGAAPVERGSRAPWAARMEARLVAGDAPGAWNVVEAAMAAGTALRDVYPVVIAPAMVSIGDRWAAGELDVAVEHRATAIVMRLMGRLGPQFLRRGRSRGGIVVGSPPGELHAMPVAMLSDLLRLEGWDVSDLGSNVPVASFARTAHKTPGVVAAGVSVTSPSALVAAGSTCAAIRAAAPEILVVLGGSAVGSDREARALGAHAHATSAAEFHELVTAYVKTSSDDRRP